MARLWPGAWNYETSSMRDKAIQSEQQACPAVRGSFTDRAYLLDGEVRMYPGIAATLDRYGESEAEHSVWEIG